MGINKYANTFYYISYTIYLVTYILTYTSLDIGPFLMAIQNMGILMLVPKYLTQRYHLKSAFISFAAFLVGLLSLQITHDRNFLVLIIYVLAAKDIQIEHLAKILFISEIVLIPTIAIMCGFGLIDNILVARDDGSLRYAIGFSHPNRLGSNLLALCFSYSILMYCQKKRFAFLFYLICALLTLFIASSRTAAFTILMMYALFILFTNSEKKYSSEQISVVVTACIGFFACMSLWFMVNYDSRVGWMRLVNALLSNRLLLMNAYYISNPIQSFGYPIDGLNPVLGITGASVIDNVYAKLAIQYGIIPLIFYIAGIFAYCFSCIKSKKATAVLIGIFIYSLVGITEWQAMHFAYNICLIGIAGLVFRRKRD